LVPPQDESTKVDATISATIMPVTFLRADGFRITPPTTMPTADIHTKNGAQGRWSSALGRITALPSPLVLMVSVTFCVPLAPGLIAGTEQFAPAGNPLQEIFTASGNVAAPTGVSSRL
jgi:hypothetical protein